jgi:hypothetical protein
VSTVWVIQAASESNALAREWVDRYVKNALSRFGLEA